ncbi:GNAT family N-acetyltransferase [Zhongshania borealis]|jgi:ribosomal protein S18 acetylase RimI-like enzyme|uniref:N-acetyltransferase domain-containing protein n=1 Tax=Zhongshania borealis TaxID=889488 RepID=A0ABP7W5Q3_9GAMM|tara:strand:+ start:1273 stop:1674 length:402 start_codon:yes stop_codon:yes gene_type:complete
MIRQGGHHDLDQITAFDGFAGCRSTEIKDGRLTVLEENGNVVGFIVESLKGLLGRPYIEYLAISHHYRRKGHAAKLIKAVEAKHTANNLFISTEATNTAMLSLLKKEGYKMSGQIANANLSGADELYFFKHID